MSTSALGVTVGDYLDTWLTGKQAPKTVEIYLTLADNYLVPHLGDIELLELRAQHVDRMYAAITLGKVGRPLSPARSGVSTGCSGLRSRPQ